MIHIECQNCGRIHYKISKEESLALAKSDELADDEFSARDLTRCSKCGQKGFQQVSKSYAEEYLHGGEIYPLLMADGEPAKTETKDT